MKPKIKAKAWYIYQEQLTSGRGTKAAREQGSHWTGRVDRRGNGPLGKREANSDRDISKLGYHSHVRHKHAWLPFARKIAYKAVLVFGLPVRHADRFRRGVFGACKGYGQHTLVHY